MIGLETQTDLAERIRQCDPAGETEFVRHFGPRVLLMCVARTRDPEASRDLVQEVLLAALTAIRQERLREAEKVSAFVLGIARNQINNFLRRRQQAPVREPLSDRTAPVTIDLEIESDERRQLMRKALEKLSTADRELLLLTLVDGWKPAEIASQLGVTSEVVRTRKLRAMRKLKEWVEKVSRRTTLEPHT